MGQARAAAQAAERSRRGARGGDGGEKAGRTEGGGERARAGPPHGSQGVGLHGEVEVLREAVGRERSVKGVMAAWMKSVFGKSKYVKMLEGSRCANR